MITPFEIYLIMQLDSIRAIFSLGAGLSAALLIGTAIFGFGGMSFSDRVNERNNLLARKYIWMPITAFLVSSFAAAFVPNTKTAAAMIIIPAIANNQHIQQEAGELYTLAKEGLRDLVADEEPSKKE